MIICPSRYNSEAIFHKLLRHNSRIGDNLSNICRKFWINRFSERNRFGEDSMFMRSSLDTRKYCFRNSWTKLFTCHYHCSTRTSKGFMSGSSNNITVWNWILEQSSSNKSSNMSNISHKDSPNTISNFSKTLPV